MSNIGLGWRIDSGADTPVSRKKIQVITNQLVIDFDGVGVLK
jgi:hypothetical protein